MKTRTFLFIMLAGTILSSCSTSPQSAYYSHDLQMETLKGKVNRVDYEFYKDRDCYKTYPNKKPYSLVYDEKGNLVSDSRYMYFDNVERDENGFFIHINTGYVVPLERHTEWDMVELSYTYDEQGFMWSSFKTGMGDDCGKRIYFYQDSLLSCIRLGDSGEDGSIDYEIIETDYNNNWTLARVLANYHYYSEEEDRFIRYQEKYYIQRIIMYSFAN